MLKWSSVAVLLLVVAAVALPAGAETCVAAGSHDWSSVASGGWSCAASGDDDFVLDTPDDMVVISGDVVLTTGSLTCSAGVLQIDPRASLTWVGPDDGTQELLIEDDCVFIMQADVHWEGRLATVGWGAGATPEETRLGLPEPSPVEIQPGDYVHFAWDDFEPIGEKIEQPMAGSSRSPTRLARAVVSARRLSPTQERRSSTLASRRRFPRTVRSASGRTRQPRAST